MRKLLLQGRIVSSFTGFNGNMLFKMYDGTYWIQTTHEYWYKCAHMPEAVITEQNGEYVLTVLERSIPVRRLSGVIESGIDGEFKGWDGQSTYKLQNGQIWQQTAYKYEYKYAYRPTAIVYPVNGGYVMAVDGTIASVSHL